MCAPDIEDPRVAAAFEAYPGPARAKLYELRALIYQTAAETEGVGLLSETLKWGQPSYQALQPKSGTPLRLGCPKDGGFALYVHCQTSVIPRFADTFPEIGRIEGHRAVVFDLAEQLPHVPLRAMIRHALTYHM